MCRAVLWQATNQAPNISSVKLQQTASGFHYDRLAHPPATFKHEKLKYDVRMPAARRYIEAAQLNEFFEGPLSQLWSGGAGRFVQHAHARSLQQLGLADAEGNSQLPLMVLNVVYPLVPEQITRFLRGQTSGVGAGRGATRIHRDKTLPRICCAPLAPRASTAKTVLSWGANTTLRSWSRAWSVS